MRPTPLAAVALLLLAGGCHARAGAGQDQRQDGSIHIDGADADNGGHVSVSIPGFGAKVSLPDINLGKHMDLNGIRLAPDTVVRNVDVAAHDSDSGADDGTVHLSFTSLRAADALIDWYRSQATAAGYTAITASGDALSATKGRRQFALTVAPHDGGSAGTITIHGGE